jgi:hypothetical protein
MNNISGPRPKGRSLRRTVTFIVIAILLLLFVAISVWGMSHSDWWYSGADQLGDAHWNRITHIRDSLVHLQGPPAAIQALDHLLLSPQAASEDVFHELIKVAQTLAQTDQTPALQQVHTELRTLIAEIQRDQRFFTTPWVTPTARPTPTMTPIIGAPVAQNAYNSPTDNCNKKG